MKIFVAVCAALALFPAQTRAAEDVRAGFIYISPAGDGGWTYAHDQGRRQMEQLPFVKAADTVENVPESGEAKRSMVKFANKGYNLIFATSYGYMDPTLETAEEYPDVIFMHCSGYKTAPNMSNYFGRMYQARYLTGIVAGMMTASNKLGYVAAHPIPEVIRGINAFTLGARAVNPRATVKVVWTYTWFDPAKEKQAAESLLEVGCDVIAQHQDTPGPQQAAEEAGAYGIGYDTDMSTFAPRAVLTSAVWDWGVIYRAVAEQVANGTWKNEPIFWGLDKGVVGLAPYGPMVPDRVQTVVAYARDLLVSGKLKVFAGPVRNQAGAVAIPAGAFPTDRELFSMDYFVEGVEGQIPDD